MKIKLEVYVLVFILTFLGSGCKKEKEIIYSVPAEAEVFVQRFKTEAEARGVAIELDNLIVEFKKNIEHEDKDYCGCSITDKNGQRVIWIDITRYCWTFGGYYREAIMFHELGHSLLYRDHNDKKLPKGNWRSLMSTGALDYYAADSLNYKRQYYLDELFQANCSRPWWDK